MKVRETILLIGNNEDDRSRFKTAIAASGLDCNFLALDNEPYSISLLKKSQPFWYHSIFFDLATPSLWGMPFIREIGRIEHLAHVPLLVLTDPCVFNDDELLADAGAEMTLTKPVSFDALLQILGRVGQMKKPHFTSKINRHYLPKENSVAI